MSRRDEGGEDEYLIAQQDECSAMSVIFDEDFALLCRDPISYSIALKRPSEGGVGVGVGCDHLALAVSYHPAYPDVAPTFRLVVRDDVRCATHPRPLHPVQERAVLDAAYGAIARTGEPCVYGCVIAAQDFLDGGGLDGAGLALLSDDCLARVLTYLVATVRDVEIVCAALPVFRAASTTNAVWRPLCRRRWRGKWGFRGRWKRTTRDFRRHDDRHYWMRAYEVEEADATRTAISRDELSSMTFDCRPWFSLRLLRNQPDNMRDVLPTGLRESVGDVVFSKTGEVSANQLVFNESTWEGSNYISGDDDGAITRLDWFTGGFIGGGNYSVHRTANWGWELQGFSFVLRAVDDDVDGRGNHRDELWGDLTRSIIVQERPQWVRPGRYHDYNYREIPDDEDYKSMLGW
ncbi:hypothetical protein ACHAW5_001807 [Stephanodiscus triporus]|uniref:RWD domain-containing protein n=1 Tax=Stephanodiscus triporus TaxID=2934178 RepID=A0ABD3QIF3_9STRA